LRPKLTPADCGTSQRSSFGAIVPRPPAAPASSAAAGGAGETDESDVKAFIGDDSEGEAGPKSKRRAGALPADGGATLVQRTAELEGKIMGVAEVTHPLLEWFERRAEELHELRQEAGQPIYEEEPPNDEAESPINEAERSPARQNRPTSKWNCPTRTRKSAGVSLPLT
jgi:hypothetical protein